MAEILVNDFTDVLAAPIDADDVSCTVATGVPAGLVGSSARVRFGTSGSAGEIVLATFDTATSWTIERAAEDGARFPASVWPAGTTIDAVLTTEGAGAALASRGNTLYVDAVHGDPDTATAGRADRSFGTLGAAAAAAGLGSLIVVRPGDYDETAVQAAGVCYWFEPGAAADNVSLTEAVTLLFGDGTYRVRGHGSFSNGATNVIGSVHAGADWEVECLSLAGPPAAGYPAVNVQAGAGVIRGAAITAASSNTGSVYVSGGSLLLDRCTVHDSAAGACVAVEGGTLVLRDCKLVGVPFAPNSAVVVEGTLTLDTAPDPSVTITGGVVVVAGAITGDGSGLTGLPAPSATSITAGTLADARLSANVPLKDAANAFTAAQTIPTLIRPLAGPVTIDSPTMDATRHGAVLRYRRNAVDVVDFLLDDGNSFNIAGLNLITATTVTATGTLKSAFLATPSNGTLGPQIFPCLVGAHGAGSVNDVVLRVRGKAGHVGDLIAAQDPSGTPLHRVRADGSVKPVQMADAAAANDSLYYSTTAGKLVYKDSAGVVNALY